MMMMMMMMEQTPANGTEIPQWKFFMPNQPGIMLTIFGACLVGAVVRVALSRLKLPYTVLLAICGFLLGLLGFHYPDVRYYTKDIADISPQLLLHIFMPVLVFNCAFTIESHTFWKSLVQVLILAVPGFVLSTCLTALLVTQFLYSWSCYVGVMFAAIVNTLDPFASVSHLHSLGTAKTLILIVEGESLFTDGTAFITFEAFRDLAVNASHVDASYLAVKLLLKVLGSPLVGCIMSKVITFWLSRIFSDGLVEVTVSLVMTYVTFYLARCLAMSGVIAVLMMGLLLETVHFSPEIEVFLLRFWEMLTYLANTLIFFIVGLVIARAFEHTVLRDFFYILVLYAALLCIRFLTVVLLSPLLCRCGYGFNWRWALVCVWGATKGAFCLSLTLMAYQAEGLDKLLVQDKMLVLSSGVVVLSLVINATSMNLFLKRIGLCEISEPKRLAMNSAVQSIKKNAQNTFRVLKVDRFLADANWEMVERRVHVDEPYTTQYGSMMLDDMIEDVRVRVLRALKMSYRKQYSSGMLNREAARTLINAAEIMTDHKGKLLTVEDIKKYWELKGLLVVLKQKMEDWLYDVKLVRLRSSRNTVQTFCCQVVFSFPFELFVYILIVLNLPPIVMEFITECSEKYTLELRVVNYVFFAASVSECVLKVLAMRSAYFLNHWNQFDLFMVALAAVDVGIEHYYASLNMHMVSTVRASKMLRLSRVLRLIKILIPRLIKVVNHQIDTRLSFGYDVLRGYIVGEQDVCRIIQHISDDQSICTTLKNVLEKNRELALRELGLLQRNHPGIAISAKTKQAARAVLNSERETLQALLLGGLLDDVEASKLEKVIEIKMKELNRFPVMVPVLTAEHLLQNLPWLHGNVARIEFIQRRSKLMMYDLGDTIVYENDEPQGIHLIVFGVVKVTRSSPDSEADDQKKSRLTEYRSCGTVIGELNCLTQRPLDFTVTCETATETCFVDINSLFEAFGVFSEEPSLRYEIWLSLATRIAADVFVDSISHQSWTYDRICSYLSDAYLMDVEMNSRAALYDGRMEDVVLIHGSCRDVQDQRSYQAPALVSRTSHQVQGTANITKLLVIPRASAGVKASVSETLRLDSAPCLQHATQRRASRRESTAGLADSRTQED